MSGTESDIVTIPDTGETPVNASTPVVVTDTTGATGAMESTADDTHGAHLNPQTSVDIIITDKGISEHIDKILETSVLETRTVSKIPRSGDMSVLAILIATLKERQLHIATWNHISRNNL